MAKKTSKKSTKKGGILSQNMRRTWFVPIVTAIVTAIVTVLLTTYIPMLIDHSTKERPDTLIHQYVTEEGPWIVLENQGEAIDRIRVEISVDPDHIGGFRVSDKTTIELANGGVGETYAKFIIDELWPDTFEYIDIKTSGTTQTAAFVKGYSLFKGEVEEEIPVVQAE